MLKSFDKEFKAGVIKLLKHSNTTSLKTNERIKSLQIFVIKKIECIKLKNSVATIRKLAVRIQQ